jgi:hypothetical protein
VRWGEASKLCFAPLISRFALALATRISHRTPNLA